MARAKLSPAAQKRVSKKIAHLQRAGECPGNPKKCVAMAHSMERAGRVTEEGGYVRVKKARRKARGR